MSASVLAGARVVRDGDACGDGARGGALAFAAGRVIDAADAPAGAARVDLRGHVVFPGLINAHDHLQLNAVPPLPHAEPFANSYAWIDAFAAHHDDPAVVEAVAVPKAARLRHGALKNLLAGATTVAHHDPWHDALDDPTFPVALVRDAGWCHSLGLGGSGRYGPDPRASHDATPAGWPWVVHLAEGTDAVARGEAARLDALGCLTERAVLVHGVGLSDDDARLAVARGAAVVWCPASNLALLGRTLDPGVARALADAGRLALGTDSRLTGARDLLDELRVARAAGDLSPAALLRLVTVDAARALRLADRGTLGTGARADCVILRAGGDAREALLGAARSDLRAVARDGLPLVADPDFGEWFAACGVATVPACLDGRPKLIAAHLLDDAVAGLEPGLAW